MSNLVALFKNQPPAYLQKLRTQSDDAFTAGGAQGPRFPRLGIRGKVFRIKDGENETPLTIDGDPVTTLYVAFVAGRKAFSRAFYEGEYDPDTKSSVVCFSTDGIAPHSQAQSPQCDMCAKCPQNVKGSKVAGGRKMRACSMKKDVLVVAADAEGNIVDATPHLLSLPAVSAFNLDRHVKDIKKHSNDTVQLQQLVTSLRFDIDAEYPELVFDSVCFLSAKATDTLAELAAHDDVAEFLEGDVPELAGDGDAQAAAEVEKPKATRRGRKAKADVEATPDVAPKVEVTPPPQLPAQQTAAKSVRDMVRTGWGSK